MKTILKSEKKTVTIETNTPFIIIGEKINPTGRKKLAEALTKGDFQYVKDLAIQQVAAGADVLDINVGVPGLDEIALLPEVAKIVAGVVDVPLCFDSANPKALAAALEVVPGKPLVNSVNGEVTSINAVLPVIKEFGAAVIALTMDDGGIPNDPEVRLSIAGRIINSAGKLGIPIENVIIDPLVLSVGADQKAGWITLNTIEMTRKEFGVNINLGASNVSFGLPDRPTINQAFLSLAIGAGASCAITDPMKLTATIRASDLLLGRDNYAMRYIENFRQRVNLGLYSDGTAAKP